MNANATIPTTFTASATNGTYSISGAATSGGTPLQGVVMSLTGSATASTVTDVSGAYTFSGLATGSYAVTPALNGFAFTPASRSVSIKKANFTGQNFTATPAGATHSISGTVTSGGSPLKGVSVELTGASSKKTTTDAGGNYIFTGLANGSYRVKPRLYRATFTPTSRAVTTNGANVTRQDFTEN
jgi:hypothetical protein